ncbi:MAG: oxygen-dependent coproporphyrinogen oxidase [Myxococcales bacterium]|nr:oxygen-dependent coproporphyrinogen oxidase [Myxococcales bacterium]
MRARAQAAVEALQDAICAALERLDGEARFREDPWERPGGGGGRTRVLEGGGVFEKAGVNTSAVHGPVPEPMRDKMPGDGDTFFATGVSLVIHPRNPHVPTTHANFRYIERGSLGWFGGGADLTPYVLVEEDARHFHRTLKAACDATDPTFYPRFKAWCDRYFHLPHRGEARGVGGIFFDWISPDEAHDENALFSWWRRTGEAFLPAYEPIVLARMGLEADDALRHWQLVRRGRYVEFNLLHDRGTKFGLESDGRTESILMSLPPLVRWDYDVTPAPGTPEAALVDVLMNPREWA